MRILFLANFFPPASRGGQEIECREARDVLEERNHETLVLTSDYLAKQQTIKEHNVYRSLELETAISPSRNLVRTFTGIERRERRNIRRLRKLVNDFEPDVLFIWGMWNLPKSLARCAEELMGDRVLYRFADYWPTLPSQLEIYWSNLAQGGPKRQLKSFLRPIARRQIHHVVSTPVLKIPNAICVSQAVKEILLTHDLPLENATVIHTGINVNHFFIHRSFVDAGQRAGEPGPLPMLYIGRLIPEKGFETVIRAFGKLARDHRERNISLTAILSGDPEYRHYLSQLLVEEGAHERIKLLSTVPRDEIPGYMAEAEIFLFPSIWPEPFSRVVLEAMAAGLAVIGTTVGGTGELLIDGETGLSFDPEDASMLAQRIVQLHDDRLLRFRLARNGQQQVLTHYTFSKTMDEYERCLQKVVKAGSVI